MPPVPIQYDVVLPDLLPRCARSGCMRERGGGAVRAELHKFTGTKVRCCFWLKHTLARQPRHCMPMCRLQAAARRCCPDKPGQGWQAGYQLAACCCTCRASTHHCASVLPCWRWPGALPWQSRREAAAGCRRWCIRATRQGDGRGLTLCCDARARPLDQSSKRLATH